MTEEEKAADELVESAAAATSELGEVRTGAG